MDMQEISTKLQAGKAKEVKALVQQAINEGIPARTILTEGLLKGMDVVGEKFKNNQIYVPEVLIAARAMNAGAAMLKPYLAEEGVTERGTVVIGTVKGDLHDIGKNLVGMMMEGKGLRVIDLGTDVPADRFVEAAKENDADIIACSALLTTTMGEMKSVVEKTKAAGLKARVIIGGAPITQNFCDSIGADGYTADAASAAELALSLCS